MRRLSAIFIGMLTVSLLFLSGCKVGLGPAVDTVPPVITIVTPSTNSANGGEGVSVSGRYKDDQGIQSVSLMLYVRDSTSLDKVAAEGWTETRKISVSSDRSAANSIHPDENNPSNGSWEYTLDTTNLPDGSYTLVATAYDGSYTSSEVEKNFDVDNTSPVLIFTQPNSIDINDPFASGSTVVITGEIGDDHSISYVEVEIYKYDAATGTAEETPISFDLVDKDGNPFTTDKLVYENVNISGGTTITLAALNENATTIQEQNLHRIYTKLYEGVETNADGSYKPAYFYAGIYSTDAAGNKSYCSWLKDEILEKLRDDHNIELNNIEVTTLKQVVNGTYTGSDKHALETVLDTYKAGLYGVDLNEEGEEVPRAFEDRNLYAFSINRDINPRYNFGDYIAEEGKWVQSTTQGVIPFNLEAGLNQDGIKPSDVRIWLHKAKLDSDGNPLTLMDDSDGAFVQELTQYTTQNEKQISTINSLVTTGNYSIQLPVQFDDGTRLGDGYYILTASGSDTKNNKLLARAVYGFAISATAVFPTIESVELATSSSDSVSSLSTFDTIDSDTVLGGTNKRYGRVKVVANTNTGEGLEELSISMRLITNYETKNVTVTRNGETTTFYSDVFDVSDMTTANATLQIIATKGDNSIKSTSTVYIVNSGPTITFSKPSRNATETYTSKVSLLGASYTSHAEVVNIQYKILDDSLVTEYNNLSSSNASTKAAAQEALIQAVLNMDPAKLSDETEKTAHENLGTVGSWNFEVTPFTTSSEANYSKISHTEDRIYTLPILFVAIDSLGNKTLVSDYTIKYDPYANRPTTKIVYPSNFDENGNPTVKKLTGTIRISGSAVDNSGVDHVIFQIDVNNDGLFNQTDVNYLSQMENEGQPIYTIKDSSDYAGYDLEASDSSGGNTFWGIETSGSVSWYTSVNSNGELAEIGKTVQGVTEQNAGFQIRAAAFDDEKILGRWSDVVTFEIDPNAPEVEILRICQYSDEDLTVVQAEKAYTEGEITSVKGQWYMEVQAKDNDGIENIYYKESTDEKAASALNGLQNAVKKTLDSKYVERSADGKTVTAKIPLGTATGEGYKYIQFIATDTSEAHLENTKDAGFRYDNKEPKQTAKISGKYLYDLSGNDSSNIIALENQILRTSNNFVGFRGYVQDTGTGFARALFYFRRTDTNDVTTSIELPVPVDEGNNLYSSSRDAKVVYQISSTEISLAKGSTGNGKVYCDEDTGLYGVKLKGITRSNTTTLNHSAVSDYKHIRAGAVLYIGGAYHTISSVSGDTITLAEEVGTNFTEAFFPAAFVVDNSSESILKDSLGASYVALDDGDGFNETWGMLSDTTWKWEAKVFADELDDGPIYIDTLVMDQADNCSSVQTTKVMLANHTPRISKVYVGVDIGGTSGKIDSNEYGTSTVNGESVNYYPVINGSCIQDTYSISSTNVKMTGDMYVGLEMLGTGSDELNDSEEGYGSGNGTLYYAADIRETKLTAPDLESLSSNNTFGNTNNFVDSSKAYLKQLKFAADTYKTTLTTDDKTYYINITVCDSTPGIAMGTSSVVDSASTAQTTYYSTFGSQAVALNIPVYVDLKDLQVPMSVIDDLYWNSSADNSLYENDKANGHIELSADLPSGIFAAGNDGVYDLDPKVSGKITLKGHAYDDQKLKSLWLYIDKKNTSSYPYASSTTITADGKTFYQLATYNGSTWTVTPGSLETNGYKFTLDTSTDAYFGQQGHKVSFTLDFDSSTVNNVAAKDVVVSLLTVDIADNVCSLADIYTAEDADDTNMNNPLLKMDVVPYIAGIKTTLRNKSGLKDTNIRSASGKYSIMYAANTSASTYAANFITVSGFNLNPAAVRIVSSETAKTSSIDQSSGITVNYSSVASDYTSFKTNNVISKSGYLEVFVKNGNDYIRSLNNINNDDAYGSAKNSSGVQLTKDNADVSDFASAYNREADYNKTKNTQLTDDRYLIMWNMHKTNTKNGYYPVMLMEGDDPVFGFVDSNGWKQTTISYGFADNMMPQQKKFDGTTGNYKSGDYLIGGLTFDQMAMAKDDAGKYIYGYVYNYANASMGVVYDKYASTYTDRSGWAYPGTKYQDQTIVQASATGNNALTLDGMNVGKVLLDRYQNLKLIAKGNSTKTTNATVYMSYYDDYYGNIIFRNFKIGTNNTLGYSMSTGVYTNQKETTSYSSSATGRNNVVESFGSKYYDFGITSDNVAVFVYYDFSEGRLRLKYSANATTANSTSKAVTGVPGTAVTFSENTNIVLPDYVGQYVSMCIDSNNHIHIAAFDANDSDLRYIYLDSFNSTSYTELIVDSAGSVGNWTSIKINNENKPVIAYYNATETGGHDAIKLAISNNVAGSVTAGVNSSTGYTATGWEYVTIPSIDPAQGGSQKFQQVCLDFDSSGKPVVGYLATNLEFGKQLSE